MGGLQSAPHVLWIISEGAKATAGWGWGSTSLLFQPLAHSNREGQALQSLYERLSVNQGWMGVKPVHEDRPLQSCLAGELPGR